MAQLRVELSMDQETYLPHEPLIAVVQVYNSSGQTLVLGRDDHWLTFAIESAEGRLVKQLKLPEVLGEFSLPSAHRARKKVNLAEAFDLTTFGRYYVTATVRIPEWNNERFASARRHFGISHGVTLWETTFGVPSGDSGRPEMRKYQLVQANHLKALSLYVRITSENASETYFIHPLGRLLGVSKPEAQMDRWSNLHVFYQDGARTFKYNMVTPEGMLLARQTWAIDDGSRPGLRIAKDGRIQVIGGIRSVSSSDLPPPELLSETKTPAPPIQEAAPAAATGSNAERK